MLLMLWPHPIPIKPEFLGDEAQEPGFLKDPPGDSNVQAWVRTTVVV